MKDLSKGAELSVCDGLKLEIEASAKALICELIEKTNLSRGDILVIGCSSSEILGNNIGKGSSFDAARLLFDSIYPLLLEKKDEMKFHVQKQHVRHHSVQIFLHQ